MEDKEVSELDTAYSIYLKAHSQDIQKKDSNIVNLPSLCVSDALVNLEVRGFKVLASQLTYPEQPERKKPL